VPFKHTFHPQLAQAIISHQEPDVSCKDCHGKHDVVSPKVDGSKFHDAMTVESCGECHGDVKEHFTASAHGKALASNVKGAPNCLTCHRNEVTNVSGLRDSLQVKLAQEKLCLSCHLDNPDVRMRTPPTAGFIAAYEKSVHGAALIGGNERAANCVDCHGSHEMKHGFEPSATVNKMNIAQTCGNCHTDIAKEFSESIHGTALATGASDAPTCTNCHGEHTILKHTDPRSPVAQQNLSQQVCSPCHTSVALSTKYGLATDRFKTFSDSYHGLALRGGSLEVANCASCHGSHNIKPSSDSTSTIYKANLATTCGKCHPGANERFAIGSVHVTLAKEEEPILYWIANTYIVLIVVTIGGMFMHNILDFVKKSKRKLKIRRGLLPEDVHGHTLYVRMTLDERIQHAFLFTSFTILVITGFMLRFPDAWWVRGIRLLSDNVFELRSLIHRIAGVILVAVSLYHVYYLAFTQRGKQLFRDMLPKLSDVRDGISMVKYNLGISSVKPRFGRFSYIEKIEYFALVWGTVIMTATGVVMWFDNTFIGLFTKLGYDISRTIHYYEAWLATLAIIVWHFYFVMFNPDVYPLNLAFWKGTLTETEMEEEHPLELEQLRRQTIAKETAEEHENTEHIQDEIDESGNDHQSSKVEQSVKS
jgi:cytochrome b subunit of formate dehydrogenase